MFCKNCGKEINSNAVVCIHCGVSTSTDLTKKPWSDGVVFIGLALAFFFPLAGGIMGIIGMLSDVNRSKGGWILLASCASFVISFFLIIALMAAGSH